MNCRCAHGRGQHRRAQALSGWERGRGQTRPAPGAWVPCQALVRVERPGWTSGPYTVAPRMVNAKCKCRNWHPVEEGATR